MEYLDGFIDDFMGNGHYIDYEDKIAAKIFWKHVIFEDNQADKENSNLKEQLHYVDLKEHLI